MQGNDLGGGGQGISGSFGSSPAGPPMGPDTGVGGNTMSPAPTAMAPDGPPPKVAGATRNAPRNPYHQDLDIAKAQFNETKKAQNVLDHVRKELDSLMDLGDIVKPEDVIGAAGRLVGHGIGATQLATLLSTMPTQAGEGLAAWVATHDVTIRQTQALMDQETKLAGHNLSVKAMRSIAALHLDDQQVKANQMMQGAGQLGQASQLGMPPGGDMEAGEQQGTAPAAPMGNQLAPSPSAGLGVPQRG